MVHCRHTNQIITDDGITTTMSSFSSSTTTTSSTIIIIITTHISALSTNMSLQIEWKSLSRMKHLH